MDTYIMGFLAFGLLGLLIIIGIFAFIIWLIQKGVQNAIEETLYSVEYREQFRNDITYSIISAKRQLENNERPSD